MTKEELDKLRLINKALDGILTVKEAAQWLDLSERQVITAEAWQQDGVLTMTHKTPSRAI